MPRFRRSSCLWPKGITKDLGALFDVYPEWKGVAPVACLQTLEIGDVLDDERHNPLIFSRTKAPVTIG